MNDRELYHYGVKGMRWGVRHDKERKSRRRSTKNVNSNGNKKFSLSDKQKKYIKIGAGIAAAGLVAYGAYKLGAFNSIDSLTKQRVTDILSFDDAEIKNRIPTPEQLKSAMTNINPFKSTSNCGSCSSAVLFNLNGGKQVQALPEVPLHMRPVGVTGETIGLGYDPDKLIDCFEHGSWEAVEGINRQEKSKNIVTALLSQPDGAKGMFYADSFTKGRAGHYFSYAIIDGKINVLESQPRTAQSGGITYIVSNATEFYDTIGRIFDPEARVRSARLDVDGMVKVKADREKDLFSYKKQ